MKRIVVGFVAGIALLLFVQYLLKKNQENVQIIENSALIQEQIKNVGKLIVTEGYFSEIITYKDAKKYLGDWISFDKKALIVVNADVLISYDLRLLNYDINPENKIVTIKEIPPHEVKIYPKITYYDLQESQFNAFTSEDHNKIREKADEIIKSKIKQSSLETNAQNRLISELAKILIITNSMGWKLQYTEKIIQSEADFLQEKGFYNPKPL